MAWLINDWKLKLLGLGLAAALLLAVAYSQFPIQAASVDARINYNGTPPTGLVVNGPPATTRVTISGVAADIRAATVTVEVDLSKVKEGTAVVIAPAPHVNGLGTTVTSVTPITLKVEKLLPVSIDIDVRVTYTQGFAPKLAQAQCGNPAAACAVTVTGPASLLQALSAYVVVDAPMNVTVRRVNGTVQFSRNGIDFDITKVVAIPAVSWDPVSVTAFVEAVYQGTDTKQVALVDAMPSAPPPSGYHVVGIIITPQLILVTGLPDALANLTSITLSAQSLAGLTSDHTFTITIVPPDPSLQLSVKKATVTYQIRPNAAVSPSP